MTCKRGHTFSPENTIMHNGSRNCRTCQSLRMKKYRALHPEKQRTQAHAAWVRNPHHNRPVTACARCKRMLPQVARGLCQTCYLIVRKENVKIALLHAQNNKCAIVGCTTDTSKYALKDWHLDHDHSCGGEGHWCDKCIRGVLCRSCNSALGFVHDSVRLLLGLSAYLRASAR